MSFRNNLRKIFSFAIAILSEQTQKIQHGSRQTKNQAHQPNHSTAFRLQTQTIKLYGHCLRVTSKYPFPEIQCAPNIATPQATDTTTHETTRLPKIYTTGQSRILISCFDPVHGSGANTSLLAWISIVDLLDRSAPRSLTTIPASYQRSCGIQLP